MNQFRKINDHQRIYKNDKYRVEIKDHPYDNDNYIWLAIRRLDRQAIHDWRDLQWIKNELVGPEHEGIELYPAESRLVDESNAFHLWVLKKQGLRFGFGLEHRRVKKKGKLQRTIED